MRYFKITLSFMCFSLSVLISAQSKKIKLKDFRIQTLSDTLREISGLTEINNKIYAINDGGNSANIYEIKKDSPYIQKNFKTNLKNNDWEAITNDQHNFYIGDFGNNLGIRKDLSIYKIPFHSQQLVSDSVQKFTFYYPEQKDFTPKNLKNNFDGEAMTFVGNDLNIFTKEWLSKKITRYRINLNIREDQPAEKLEDYKLGYVATDADFYKGKLYVVGYTKTGRVFLTIFTHDGDGFLFREKVKKFRLGSAVNIGQIEGLVLTDQGLLLSSEAFDYKIGKVRQSLYFIPHEKVE